MSSSLNIMGQKFGKLTVIERAENTKAGKTRWLCQYDCGNRKVVTGSDLRSGHTTSCGCAHYEKTTLIDLTGKKFGRLMVLKRVFPPNTKNKAYWLCQCDCGNTIVCASRNLREGSTKSCGCLQREIAKERATVHGFSGEPLYHVHNMMKQRCFNPNNKNFKDYGGRGIQVCKEWLDYAEFRKWATENGYKQGLSIERINNDGNYCPENCTWITLSEQQKNRRPRTLQKK